MKTLRILPLALALGLATGCSKSETNAAGAGGAAGTLGDAAKGLADKAKSAFGDLSSIDPSSFATLEAGKLQEIGKTAMAAIASQLGSIKDVAGATSFKTTVEPMLAKLTSLKSALNGKLPDMDTVKTAIAAATTKLTGNADVMKVLQPVLDKLKGLVG